MASVLNYRHLLKEFITREIKGRFAGSIAGMLWTLINPIVNIIIYLFLFSMVFRVQVTIEETGTDRFVIFFLSGFFPWIMFSESLSRSVGILIQNANLITKVVFPVELLPAGAVLSVCITNGIGLTIFILFLAFIGYIHTSWLLLILLIPIQMIFIWGLAALFAAICVFIRDISELLAIILQIWFYATPIIYPLSMLPDAVKTVVSLNPMAIFVNLYRQILLVHQVDWGLLLHISFISFITYAIGAWFFMRAKPAFGDVL